MTQSRRTLRFSSLQEVMPEVQRLLAGHRTVGRWSLAQICNHLVGSFAWSVEGFPGWPAPWLVRATLGNVMWQLMSRTGRIAEGVRIPQKYLPTAAGDALQEAQALHAAIQRFTTSTGPFACHPIVGQLNCEQWQRFHCIHSAHHLSVVVPLEEAKQGGSKER